MKISEYNNNLVLTNVNDSTKKAHYNINIDGNYFAPGDVVLSVASGEAYDEVVEKTIVFWVSLGDITTADEYKDTLTFTVDINKEKFVFYVGDDEFEYVPGMTWGDFINSEYNTFGFSIGESYEMTNPDGSPIEAIQRNGFGFILEGGSFIAELYKINPDSTYIYY